MVRDSGNEATEKRKTAKVDFLYRKSIFAKTEIQDVKKSVVVGATGAKSVLTGSMVRPL